MWDLLARQAGAFEISTECEVEVDTFAEPRGADFRELILRTQVLTGKPQDSEHIVLPFSQPVAGKCHRFGTAPDHLAERAFALDQIVLVRQRVFHILEGAKRDSVVAGDSSLLLRGADVLCS